MNKKIKIAYWVVMTLNVVVCIVDIAMARYGGAALSGMTLIWLAVCYMLSKINSEQESLINELLKQLKACGVTIAECTAREKIHHQELAKMRQRAQDAEKKLQEMIDDTPARGKDGRYVKREN